MHTTSCSVRAHSSSLHYGISWFHSFDCVTKRFVSMIKSISSLNFWSEDHLWLSAVHYETLFYLVLSWTWELCLFGCFHYCSCFWLLKRFLPSDYSTRILRGDVSWVINFVITRTNAINSNSSKSNLIWLLLNELSSHIFFISKDAQMTWNRRWVHYSGHIFRFCFFECHSSNKLIFLRFLLIRAWTWLLASFSLISILKPLLFRLKVTTIFDDLYTKAF